MSETLTIEQQELIEKQEVLRQEHYTYWLAMLVHKNTQGKPLEFERRPELIPIYLDESQHMVIQKSVQCGVSEYLIVYTLGKAESGLSIFYILPTIAVKHRFVQNRVNTAFIRVPYYQEFLNSSLGEADNLTMKHYGQGTIIFCGSNSPDDLIEFPADVKIVDEIDRCDQQNLGLADDRLTASEYKITKEVGNPTVVDYGINAEYKDSDQKNYYFKCSGCNHWFTPDWFKHVVREVREGYFELLDEEHIVCDKCARPVPRGVGQWVAHNPKSDVSGYLISKLISPLHDLPQLFKKFMKARRSEINIQIFHNSDLGLAFSGVGVEVTDAMLNALGSDYWIDGTPPPTPLPTTCGVDVGTHLHVVIRDIEEPRIARYIGKVSTFEQVEGLLKEFNVISTVVDALPETREAAKFRDRVGENVWLCYYLGNNSNQLFYNEDVGQLKVDRTFALDGMFGRNGDIALGQECIVNPRNAIDICDGEYREQMKDLVRIFNPDIAAYQYKSRTGVDHFAHAENYCKLATQAPDMGYCGDVY